MFTLAHGDQRIGIVARATAGKIAEHRKLHAAMLSGLALRTLTDASEMRTVIAGVPIRLPVLSKTEVSQKGNVTQATVRMREGLLTVLVQDCGNPVNAVEAARRAHAEHRRNLLGQLAKAGGAAVRHSVFAFPFGDQLLIASRHEFLAADGSAREQVVVVALRGAEINRPELETTLRAFLAGIEAPGSPGKTVDLDFIRVTVDPTVWSGPIEWRPAGKLELRSAFGILELDEGWERETDLADELTNRIRRLRARFSDDIEKVVVRNNDDTVTTASGLEIRRAHVDLALWLGKGWIEVYVFQSRERRCFVKVFVKKGDDPAARAAVDALIGSIRLKE